MKSGSEILNEFLQKECINPNQLAAKMKLSRTQPIYDILNGKIKRISENYVDKILEEYPKYNKVWLLTGEGDMLKSGEREMEIKDAVISAYEEKIKNLEYQLKEKEKYISSLEFNIELLKESLKKGAESREEGKRQPTHSNL
jgi:plasmid maintenance system antidote protein VapI